MLKKKVVFLVFLHLGWELAGNKIYVLNSDTMNELFNIVNIVFVIVNIVLSSSLLYQIFLDYKRRRIFIASIDFVFAIMLITCYICVILYCTFQIIT